MNKESVYMTWFFMGLAIVPMLIMTLGRTALSWSQNHLFQTDYLLYATLSGIMSTFLIRSFQHNRKDRMMFRIVWNIRQRHWNRLTALLFACVMFFGVNHDGLIGTLHLVFTGVAIASAYVGMVWYYQVRTVRSHGAILGAACGVLGFLFAYLTPFLTTAEGEMIAAIPITIYVFSTTKID